MTYAPTNPLDVPPYQTQNLIGSIISEHFQSTVSVQCAQALGSEIYVGCSNGELMRFALQADDPNTLESYSLLSRQTVLNSKPIEEIVLLPSISRALVLSDNQLHFYTLPSLDVVPYNVIKPIRHVVTFAVDHKHLKRPPLPPSGQSRPGEEVEFCVVKRNALSMYALRERLSYQKEIPLPQGAILARRIGRILCMADRTNYNILDLETAVMIPLLPLSQAMEPTSFTVKPSITLVSDNEFLILSWTGASTIGIFITTEGDPTRGTLEWPSHPEAVCFDYPYVATLLSNNTIEIHSVETQAIVQVISTPAESDSSRRLDLITSLGGYMVPSTQRSNKMRKVPVQLLRGV